MSVLGKRAAPESCSALRRWAVYDQSCFIRDAGPGALPDWAWLFATSYGAGGPITARMAASMHHMCTFLARDVLAQGDAPPYLPPAAAGYWRSAPGWAECFAECFRRLALRLRTGSLPVANCRAEAVALVATLEAVKNCYEPYYLGSLHALPSAPADTDYGSVLAACVPAVALEWRADETAECWFRLFDAGAGPDELDEVRALDASRHGPCARVCRVEQPVSSS